MDQSKFYEVDAYADQLFDELPVDPSDDDLERFTLKLQEKLDEVGMSLDDYHGILMEVMENESLGF